MIRVSGEDRGIVAQGVTESEDMTRDEIPAEIRELDPDYPIGAVPKCLRV